MGKLKSRQKKIQKMDGKFEEKNLNLNNSGAYARIFF